MSCVGLYLQFGEGKPRMVPELQRICHRHPLYCTQCRENLDLSILLRGHQDDRGLLYNATDYLKGLGRQT